VTARPPDRSYSDAAVLAVAAVVAATIVVVAAGAALAALAGGHPRLPPMTAAGPAVAALVRDPAHPKRAWPPSFAAALPGAALYWAATVAVAAGVAVVGAAVAVHLPGRRVGSRRRRPLGVDATPQFASRRDLTPLRVRAPGGDRFLLGRHHGRWLATENGRTRGTRRGDRGAVALIGPSRSGKTTAAITGILHWEGPAILSSVKADLLDATVDARAARGHIRLYDPTSTTGRRGDGSWSPIRTASTTIAAQRAARSLCDAAPKNGVDGGDEFWLAQAEILLSGLLYVAHHTAQDMATLADWVMTQDRPTEHGTGQVHAALNGLFAGQDPVGAKDAQRALRAIWSLEEKTRSSVYATAQTVIWPWSDPGVARAARTPNITLEWLTAGANTAYLCAPIEDQRRLAPAFGGLLNDLIKAIYLQAARTGRPLDPPLLIVLDEAGNTPLRGLPEFASTLAGLGVVLVTIWQSIGQIEAAHGRHSDTILTNHLTKLLFAGVSDQASLRYVAQVLGDTEVETTSRSFAGPGRPPSTSLSTTRTGLAPAHAVRQMVPGDALLIHGTLPPAHVRTIPFYRPVRRRRPRRG
jgi:type IV secretion system protein VirD4